MTDLITHNFEYVETIFQLLGNKENDITRAIAWVLKKCPSFLNLFIRKITKKEIQTQNISIYYQQFEKTDTENGYTDLEITDNKNFHIIVEAKRGWFLPTGKQLTKYAHRSSFSDSKVTDKKIVSLSECSQEYANSYLTLKQTDNGIPVMHYSWQELYNCIEEAKKDANNEQKHLLEEFALYMGGLMTMQDKNSNRVFVVSISEGKRPNTDVKWIDIVKGGHYFCPMGKDGYPKNPPNYIAFRYKGQLLSIHHIEGYAVTKNLHDKIDIMPNKEEECDYFIFDLGPKIVPQKVVKTGDGIHWNLRVWADIDLLLTCDTITKARDETKNRDISHT